MDIIRNWNSQSDCIFKLETLLNNAFNYVTYIVHVYMDPIVIFMY